MTLGELLGNINLLQSEQLEELKRTPFAALSGEKREYYWTLDKLNQLFLESDFTQEANAENLQPFFDFLSKRWEFVGKFPVTLFPSARICFLLADALANFSNGNKNRYQILMPNVTSFDNTLTATDFSNSDFLPLVLGDNNEIIEVLACLDFAKVDGVLKHTQITFVEGKATPVRQLSESEANSVINYSPESKKYYEKIQALMKRKTQGMSIGAFIERLIDKLHAGSVAGTNNADEALLRERNAANDVNSGMFEFIEFLATLEGCRTEFVTELPALDVHMPNRYFLMKNTDAWVVAFRDKHNKQRILDINTIQINEFKWNKAQERSFQVVTLLRTVLAELDKKMRAAANAATTAEQDRARNAIIEAKSRVSEVIENYHYNSPNGDDGTQKADLYRRRAPSSHHFKHYFDRLANPHIREGDSELSTSYCVKLISSDLRTILAANKDLYNIHPQNNEDVKEVTLQIVENEFEIAHTRAHAALSDPNFSPPIRLTAAQEIEIQKQIILACGEGNSVKYRRQLQEYITQKADLVLLDDVIIRILKPQQFIFMLQGLEIRVSTMDYRSQFITKVANANPFLIKKILQNPNLLASFPVSIGYFLRNEAVAYILAADYELFNSIFIGKENYFAILSNWLCLTEEGLKVFYKLLQANPTLAANLTAGLINGKPFTFGWSLASHSPLAQTILCELLMVNDAYRESITFDTAAKLCNTETGRRLFRQLVQDRLLESLTQITTHLICTPLELNRHLIEPPIYYFSTTTDGMEILQYLLLINPQLLSVRALYSIATVPPHMGTSPFYWLISSVSGRELFNKRCDTDPSFMSHLSVECLCSVKRYEDNAEVSPLYILASSISGQKILQRLFAANPALLGISAEALCKRVSNCDFPDTSAFYRLLSNLDGRCIINQLMDANPELVMDITEEFLTTRINNDEYAAPSPLQELNKTDSGRHILLRLAQNPQLTSVILRKLGVPIPSDLTELHLVQIPLVQKFACALETAFVASKTLPMSTLKQAILQAAERFIETAALSLVDAEHLQNYVLRYANTSSALTVLKFHQYGSYDRLRAALTRQSRECTSFDALLAILKNAKEKIEPAVVSVHTTPRYNQAV